MARPFRVQAQKFGAKRTNGYASKREADYAGLLQLQKNTGVVLDWLEQVPIKLPGTKYVVDFMVIYPGGKVKFVEVKGMETPAWRAKMRALAELRPDVYAMVEVVK
jgi:hypothetical protein